MDDESHRYYYQLRKLPRRPVSRSAIQAQRPPACDRRLLAMPQHVIVGYRWPSFGDGAQDRDNPHTGNLRGRGQWSWQSSRAQLAPCRRDAWTLYDLSQRKKRACTTSATPRDDAFLRFVPPHHDLESGELHAQRGGNGRVRRVPQRRERDGQTREPLRHLALLRHLPPDDGMASVARVPAPVAGLPGEPPQRRRLRGMSPWQQRVGDVAVSESQARVRRVPRPEFSWRSAVDYAARPARGSAGAPAVDAGARLQPLESAFPRVPEAIPPTVRERLSQPA